MLSSSAAMPKRPSVMHEVTVRTRAPRELPGQPESVTATSQALRPFSAKRVGSLSLHAVGSQSRASHSLTRKHGQAQSSAHAEHGTED